MRRPDLRRYPLQRAAACSGMIADRFGTLNMRVAGVDPERKFGGGEVQVLGLTLELKRAGHEVELLCDPDGLLWRRAQQGHRVLAFANTQFARFFGRIAPSSHPEPAALRYCPFSYGARSFLGSICQAPSRGSDRHPTYGLPAKSLVCSVALQSSGRRCGCDF